jgi:drug/metabolite transporter (DMT)-like permease
MASLYLLLPIGILAISTASIFIKLCDAPALTIAAYRMVISSLILLPFAIHQKVWNGWSRDELGWLTLSGILLSLHFVTWIASLRYTSVASSVVLVTTQPIFVGIGEWLLMKERMKSRLILGIVLCGVGSALIGYGDMTHSQGSLFGDVLAVLGAITASGYFLVGRKMRKKRNLISYIFPVYSTAGLLLVILVLLFQKPFFGYSSSTYLYLVLLAVVPQLIGHTTFNWALKYMSASLVVITILGEPVGSTMLAYLILAEGLTVWKVLGGISIFSGILIALRNPAVS